MKKQKQLILLLSIVMTLIFAGLLIIQIKYIKDTTRLRNIQFDESVARSLSDVLVAIEVNEANKYLNLFLEDESKKQQQKSTAHKDSSFGSGQNTSDFFERGISYSFEALNSPIFSDNYVTDDLSATNVVQKRFEKQFSTQKEYLENIVVRWLKETAELPVQERINFNELDVFIKNALSNNGVKIPYHFAVFSRSNDNWIELYRCTDFREIKGQVVFEQRLFPNEHTDKPSYLKLYFPTKDEFILSSMSLVLPSVILITLLLITFTIILLIIFRQKKLDDIKSDFVSNMTHEIKTPISTISLASQMLQEDSLIKTPESVKPIASILNSETKRLGFLVEKILLMSIEHENSSLKRIETDVNDLIATSIASFSLKAENNGGKIICELNAENAWAKVDETHFTNVIFNLMDNAVKYGKVDEPLILTLKTWNDDKGFLCISIADNGIGIKKEHLDKIFDKFFRIISGNVHNVKGFGLGLAYVKKIIGSHKGFITVESEVNQGTKFIIKIRTLKKID